MFSDLNIFCRNLDYLEHKVKSQDSDQDQIDEGNWFHIIELGVAFTLIISYLAQDKA